MFQQNDKIGRNILTQFETELGKCIEKTFSTHNTAILESKAQNIFQI